MYTKEQLEVFSSNINLAIRTYHEAIATNLQTLKTSVPVQGDNEDEKGIEIAVKDDCCLTMWLVDQIKWDEERSAIMVHISSVDYKTTDEWVQLEELQDGVDYVLEAIQW